MRINSVNSANQYQQRNPNFGMVRFQNPEIPYKITATLKADGITAFSKALEKLKTGQTENILTDILFKIGSSEKPLFDLVRTSDDKLLRCLTLPLASETPITNPDSIIKVMEEAGELANSFSELEKAAQGIKTIGKSA